MVVTVRLQDGETTVAVQVLWRSAEINLLRDRQETLERFLVRLGISCSKHAGVAGDRKRAKKELKKRQAPPGAAAGVPCSDASPHKSGAEAKPATRAVVTSGVPVSLLAADGASIAGSIAVVDALQQAAHLEIDGERLPVAVNPPGIKKLRVFCKPFSGCPLVASLQCEFCDAADFSLTWLRHAATAGRCKSQGQDDGQVESVGEADADHDGKGRVYVVPDGAEGQSITLQAEWSPPGVEARGGGASSTVRLRGSFQVGVVEKVPIGWPDRELEAFGRRLGSPNSIRVVSYNILAMPYTRSHAATKDMYPYCPPHALDLDYRLPLLGRSLMRLDGDIVCLQECEYATYTKYLLPLFGETFHVRVSLKKSQVSEGCAMLVRRDAFDIVEETQAFFRDVFQSDAAHAGIFREVASKWPGFVTSVLPNMTTVFQLSAVRHKHSGELLVIANTHLFFHPAAMHIRLLQVFCLLHEVQRMRERIAARAGEASGGESASSAAALPRVLFCGDLNSQPDSAVLQLLLTAQVGSDHAAWAHALEFKWARDDDGADTAAGTAMDVAMAPQAQGGGDAEPQPDAGDCDVLEALPENERAPGIGLVLHSPLTGALTNAYGDTKELRFTNYVQDFNGILDYIFFSEGGFRVVQTLLGASEEDLLPLGGLPSLIHPSDHVPVAADLELLPGGKPEAQASGAAP